MVGKAWDGSLYDGPSVRRAVAVWLVFGIPGVLLSRLTWLESIVWWLMLGVISMLIAAVTVRIVLWPWSGPSDPHAPPVVPEADNTGGLARRDSRAGPALVASTTTWAIAWLLILSTLAPDQPVARSAHEIAWSVVGLVVLGIAVTAMCVAVSAILGRNEYGRSGASWLWSKLTGRDLLAAMPGGHGGLALAVILSAAAITGWLWLLTQATRLAFLYAGWSR